MATFQYTARTPRGEEVSGVLQADTQAAAVRALDEQRLFPVRVTQQAAAGPALRSRRVRPRDVGVVYAQLGDLLRAGVPLLRSLETLTRATTNQRLVELLRATRDAVAAGESLSDALAKHPEAFPRLHLAMIRAGERGGFVEDVLTNLAGYIERQDELAGKVRGAMIYPLVLTVIGGAVMIILLIGLVPTFKPLFEGIELPLPSRIVFALSDALLHRWPLLLAGAVAAGLGVRALARSDAGRRWWDRWRLSIPVLGSAVRMTCVARFCRILGTMLANGVPVLPALAIGRDATGSLLLSEHVGRAEESVRSGQTLAQPLRESGFVPAEIVEMIAVAEESNQLEKVLVQVAETVERRTARQVDQVVRLIEPLILVVMAGIILFVAMGLLYPIFTMSQTLR